MLAQRVRTLLDSSKNEDGTYVNVFAHTASGAQTKLYLNYDQSPQQMAVERNVKKLKNIFLEHFPDRDVRTVKSEGVITVDWEPMAKVFCPRSRTVQLKWYQPTVEKHAVTLQTKDKIIDREGPSYTVLAL